VVEVAEQQRVRDEARLVPHDDRRLLQRPGQLGGGLHDVGLGDHGPDDLDQVLHRRRVEEVHPDDPAGVRRRGADLGDRERGGVRGQDRVQPDDGVEGPEDLLLHGQLLHDRLDDEAAVLHVGHVGGERDPADELVLLLLGELAALHRPAGRVLHVLTSALEGLLGQLHADDLVAVAGEDLGDAGTHRAEADHADGGELASVARHGPNHGTAAG
jgi:hypothetical protein